VQFLANFSRGHQGDMVDYAGRLAKNEKGQIVYNFGKHKGKTLKKLQLKLSQVITGGLFLIQLIFLNLQSKN
jgi:tRNA U34 2-thiouridine synthase MnmA/TrmU